MNHEDFRRVHCTLSALIDDDPDPWVHHTIKDRPRPSEFLRRETWLDGERSNTRRTRPRAFLLAYLAVFGPRLPALGGHLDDGYVLWDKGVMRFHLQQGNVELIDGEFIVTETGRDFLGRET